MPRILDYVINAQYPGLNVINAQYPGLNVINAQYPGLNVINAQDPGLNVTTPERVRALFVYLLIRRYYQCQNVAG